MTAPLEKEFQRKLNLPRVVVVVERSDRAKFVGGKATWILRQPRSTIPRSQGAALSRRTVVGRNGRDTWGAEIGRIEQVENLSPELQSDILLHRKFLKNREVCIFVRRSEELST